MTKKLPALRDTRKPANCQVTLEVDWNPLMMLHVITIRTKDSNDAWVTCDHWEANGPVPKEVLEEPLGLLQALGETLLHSALVIQGSLF